MIVVSGESDAVARVEVKVWVCHRLGARPGRCAARIPRHTVANAAKAASPRLQMRFQHRGHGVTQIEVNLTDDPRRDACRTIRSRGAHRRDAVDEFGFPDYSHGLGAIGLVHGATLHENSRYDVVPTIQVGQDLV